MKIRDAVLVRLRDGSASGSVYEAATANELTAAVARAGRWHSVMLK